MVVIGHRGAPHEALENSFSSFSAAIDSGAQRIELDAHLTRDGEIVIMHDADLSRTCGIHATIHALDWSQLKNLRLKNGEPIPRLEEVLDQFVSKIELNVEIKGSSLELAAACHRLFEKKKCHERIIISCFRPEPLIWFANNSPQTKIACLIGDWPRWPQIDEQMPTLFMERTGARVIHPWVPMVDENFMDQCQNRGWSVVPYTSARGEEDTNREDLWAYLYSLGIDGLCTNYPRELCQWLAQVEGTASIRSGN